MCTPTILAGASLLTGIAGAGMQAAASYRAADAKNKAAKYNEAILAQNAQRQEAQAQNAEARGRIRVKEELERKQDLLARQRVGFAASGVDVGSGSALDVFADTDFKANRDIQDINLNTMNEALALRTGAARSRQQQTLSRFERDNRSPLLAGVGSALTSAPPVIQQYGTFRQKFNSRWR